MRKNNKVKAYMISESVANSTPRIISDNQDITVFEATLQEGDVPNRNKRKYSTAVLKDAMEQDFIKERIQTKSWYGESGR